MDTLDNQFHQLHQDGLLILTNVADAAGARIVEQLGSKAVATSSAAVAWAHGYPDGNALPLERLISTVESIARVISVPLTVDIEAGYSDDLTRVADLIDAVIAAGAVGINIEDGASPPELLVRKIEIARQVASRRNVKLFINARTDVYLKKSGARRRSCRRDAQARRVVSGGRCRWVVRGWRHGRVRNRCAVPGHPAAGERARAPRLAIA